MTYEQWQIGLEIQEDGIKALALVSRGGQLRLRRWWQLALPPGCISNGSVAAPDALIATLTTWRKTLPWRHRMRLGFPAHRTLIRQVPFPTAPLNAPECERYIAAATARQLGLAPEALMLDYQAATDKRHFIVTAAQREEVARLSDCIGRAGLRLSAVAPDANALCTLLSRLGAPLRGVVSWQAGKWIMACGNHWGWADAVTVTAFEQACALLGTPADETAWCELPPDITAPAAQHFNPWSLFGAPSSLPPRPLSWLTTIALAAGEVQP